MDWAFLRPDLSLQAPEFTAVGRAVLRAPEGRKLYRERVGMLFTNVFRVPVLMERIDRELAKIRTGNFSPSDWADIERRAGLMRERIMGRVTRASNELAGVPPVPLKFDTNGVAALTDWRADQDGGTGVVARVNLQGKPTLHIAAAGTSYRPSWRSLVYLPRGSYRYEASLRVVSKGPILAMLRISGPAHATMLHTATAWRTLTYDFEVGDDAGHDVEFVCDFSGAEGDAWFDLSSLRVRRVSP